MHDHRVLVFPRSVFGHVFSLLLWEDIQQQIHDIEASFSWLERPEAEGSVDWVQAIPCAVIRNSHGHCCVMRRVPNDRSDLNRKLTLIVGGHIDHSQKHRSFNAAMTCNLMRELEEEVGLLSSDAPRPIGVMIDNSSVQASRHVAFLHELTADHVSLKAPEEFVARSNMSGKFLSASELAEKIDEFDPWSKLLIEEYVCVGDIRPNPRQSFLL